MLRKSMKQMVIWNEEISLRPFVLFGARGTGKTYMALEFAKDFYPSYLYCNLEMDISAAKPYQSMDRYQLSAHLKTRLNLKSGMRGLIILDEISNFPDLLQITYELSQISRNLKFLLITSFPSELLLSQYGEKIFKIRLTTLDFEEFLGAEGREWYVGAIRDHFHSNKNVPVIVHNELLKSFKLYLMTGGMPAAVNEYLSLKTGENVYQLHQIISNQFLMDAEKQLKENEAAKVRAVLKSIPLQLFKSNKKFQYCYIRKGAAAKQYESAVRYLIQNDLLIPSYKWGQDHPSVTFKLYNNDVGMLYSSIRNNSTNVECDWRKSIHHGILENYVAVTLTGNQIPNSFWESKSLAKIDFVINGRDGIIPLEIRPGDTTRSKNASAFRSVCDFPYVIKLSERNFEWNKGVKYVPFYAVFCII